MYEIYMDGLMLPVAPPAISTKINGKNRVINLVNGGEINLIQGAGLTEISFSFLLPAKKYPFAVYESGFKEPIFYLKKLIKLKNSLNPFKLIIIRNHFHSSSMQVTLENFSILEDKEKNDSDVIVNVNLKEYAFPSVKKIKVKPVIYTQRTRPSDKKIPTVYTVKKGDCLWEISRRFFGDGNRFKEIYRANQALIDRKNENTGYPIYTIYPGQKLKIQEV